MDRNTVWSAECAAAMEAVAALAASIGARDAFPAPTRAGEPASESAHHPDSAQDPDSLQDTGSDNGEAGSDSGADPLRRQVDECLDGLAEIVRLEAWTAARKAQLTVGYAQAARAKAEPHDFGANERALTAELACVLTVSE